MAGGMRRRGDRETLAQRSARSRGESGPADVEPARAVPATPGRGPSPVRHCWAVRDDAAPEPGLLLGWEQRATGWWGRVLHPVADADRGGPLGLVVVEEWLPSERLRPA